MSECRAPDGDISAETGPATSLQADLYQVMADLSDAFVFIETVINALDGGSDRAFPELPVLEHGLAAAQAAYNKLDLITGRLEE